MLNYKEKINSWLPSHFKGRDYDSIINGMAKVFETAKTDLEDFITQTFISQANTEYLNVHAKERGFSRVNYGTAQSPNFESNEDYQNRVRRIKYNRTKQNIIDNVRSVLGVVDVRVIDDYEADFLDDTDQRATQVVITGGTFGNQGPLDLKKRFNCFSVMIDTPDEPPLSFYDKGYYYDKDFFSIPAGTRKFSPLIARIVNTLIALKAPAGSGYRLLVKDFAGSTTIGDETKQEQTLNG